MVWTPITILPAARETCPLLRAEHETRLEALFKERYVHFAVYWPRNWALLKDSLRAQRMTAMVNSKIVLNDVSTWRRVTWAFWASCWVLPACHEGAWWTHVSKFSKHKLATCHLPLATSKQKQAPSVLWLAPHAVEVPGASKKKKLTIFQKSRFSFGQLKYLQTPIYRRLNSEFCIYIHYRDAFRQLPAFIDKIYILSPSSYFGTIIPQLG